MIDLNGKAKKPAYLQIYEQFADRIDKGFYESGQKIASIRSCAREFGVSNTTVELAYQRLTEEGYVTARQGSGYTVSRPIMNYALPSNDVSPEAQRELDALVHADNAARASDEVDFDFQYDAVDATYFPFREWARISRDVLLEADTNSICSQSDPQGIYELRSEIARYLTSEHAIRCIPEQILVAPSMRLLIDGIISLFDPEKTVIGIENPGFSEMVPRLQREGYDVKPVPTYPVTQWEDVLPHLKGIDVLLTTPVSQLPTNMTMPTAMREQMVRWANASHVFIIDNGYCREFGIGNPRPPALAALDTEGCVISLGTFSNSFSPSICLSYAVLPPTLMTAWKNRKDGMLPSVPWQTQASMAEFMGRGLWIDHMRRTRTAVLRKRSMMLEAIHAYLGKDFDVIEGESSFFVLMRARDGRSEQELIDSALSAGARVYPTSRYWCTTPPDDWHYVLIGFTGMPDFKIESGIKALAKAWGVRTRSRRRAPSKNEKEPRRRKRALRSVAQAEAERHLEG